MMDDVEENGLEICWSPTREIQVIKTDLFNIFCPLIVLTKKKQLQLWIHPRERQQQQVQQQKTQIQGKGCIMTFFCLLLPLFGV
jgi:hypothetical protein